MISLLKLCEDLIESVKKHGWLSIANMIYDNMNACSIVTTHGNVAISESHNSCYWFSCLDGNDSNLFQGAFVHDGQYNIGYVRTLCQQDLDCLQWFSYNMCYHIDFTPTDGNSDIPFPKYPSPELLLDLTKNEKTGLYDGYPIVGHAISDSNYGPIIESSVIDMFDSRFGECRNGLADIDNWKKFYKQHEKFLEFLKVNYGVTDAI